MIHTKGRVTAMAALLRALGTYGEKSVLAQLLSEMQLSLASAWDEAAQKAIKKSIDDMEKKRTVSAGIAVLFATLKKNLSKVVDKGRAKKLAGMVDATYVILKRRSTTKLGIGYNFKTIDRRAVKALGRENPFWINTFYDRHLSNRISEISRVLVVESGLGVHEGAKAMERALRREFALRGGGLLLEDIVPSQFAGNIEQYSRILTSNVANRARNFSAISSYIDAGIERYRITAVLDNRTSEICQYMNGKEFTVQVGRDLMERMTDTDPENLKKIHPWVSAKEAKKIAGKGTIEKQNVRLANSGLALPPYHGRCRTLVEGV